MTKVRAGDSTSLPFRGDGARYVGRERVGKRIGETPPTPAVPVVSETGLGLTVSHPLTEPSAAFTGSPSTDEYQGLFATTALTWKNGDEVFVSAVTPSTALDAGNYFIVDSTGGSAFSLSPDLDGDAEPIPSTMAATISRYLPSDVTHLNVYASSSTGFTPTQALKVGEIAVNRLRSVEAASSTAGNPSLRWPVGDSVPYYIKVSAVNSGGKESAASADHGSTAVVGSLENLTITGALTLGTSGVIRTAASGQRVYITGSNPAVLFVSGSTLEVATGYAKAEALSGVPVLSVVSPFATSGAGSTYSATAGSLVLANSYGLVDFVGAPAKRPFVFANSNVEIRGNIDADTASGAAFPAVVTAARVSDTAINNANDTELSWDAQVVDGWGGFAPTNTDINLEKGYYLATANVWWEANASGIRRVWISLNNSEIARVQQSAASAGGTQQSVTVPVVSTSTSNFLSVYVRQTSGGALNVEGSTSAVESRFHVVRLAETT